jgi:hypothetical protein
MELQAAYYQTQRPAEKESQMVMHLAVLPDERAASDPEGSCLADGRRELDASLRSAYCLWARPAISGRLVILLFRRERPV